MSQTFEPYPHAVLANPRADREAIYPDGLKKIISLEAHDAARREITAWPAHAVTPLHDLAGLASALRVNRIWYKDESERFGLGSFKALGGAYALLGLLREHVGQRTGGEEVSTAEIREGKYLELVSGVTAAAATDGNHGRSVAWGAQMFGCACVIYLNEDVSDHREAVIARYGARIVRVEGSYDDSVARCARDAHDNGWLVVSDTSYPGYMDVPRRVMQGYTVMVGEMLEQLPAGERPSHVFVQGGVGGLAAAVCGHFWERWGAERPTLVVVEPEEAACLFESAAAGQPARASGDLKTVMAMLSCGEVSLVAWDILEGGADFFMTVPDEAAEQAVVALAKGAAGDPSIVAGESGAAGLAGLLAAAVDPDTRLAMGLSAGSRILLIGTEGATDPEIYERIVSCAQK